MDENEKMLALKKAYAEIILNTGKEAAARVMASERKALRFQHDLRSTKDDAFRMLLCLKQMIDVKKIEAENTSLSQQRRIEELDAQLNEAEEMIVDLRAELRKAQDKLEEVKNNHKQQSNGSAENEDTVYSENTTHEKILDTSKGLASFSPCGTCCNPEKQTATSSSHLDSFLVDNPNIASIIMKSKGPKLYRNGCTQRIRAILRNLGDVKISGEDVPDQDLCTKNEAIVNENEQNLWTCALSSIKAGNTDIKNLDGSEIVSISNPAKYQLVKIRKSPRSRIKYVQSKVRFRRRRSAKPHRPSLTSPLNKPEKMNFKENSSEQEEKAMDNNERSSFILRRSLRKRKVGCWDDNSPLSKSLPNQFEESSQPPPALSRCKKYSGKDGVGSVEHIFKSKLEAEMEKVMGPVSTSKNVTEDAKPDKVSDFIQNNVVESTELIDVLVKHEGATTEIPGISSCNLNIEVEKVLLEDFDLVDLKLSESTDEGAGHTDKNRLLKYTFSRRRKKDLLTKSDECSSLGKISMYRRMGEKLSVSPEQQKTNLINDPSNESEGLVEVACQLISLSGNIGGKRVHSC